MHDDRKAVKVGAVVLATIFAAVAVVLALEGRHVRPGLRIKVTMQSVGSLRAGDTVKISGRMIGTVDQLRLVPRSSAPAGSARASYGDATVVLDLWIDRRHAWLLSDRTEFFVHQQTVLSKPHLEAGPPRVAPGRRLHDGDVVRGVDPPRIDRLMQRGYENLLAVTNLFREGVPEAGQLSAALEALGHTLGELDDGGRTGLAAGRLWREGVSLLEAVRSSGVTGERLAGVAAKTRRLAARARADLGRLAARAAALPQAPRDAARPGSAGLARLWGALARVESTAAKVERLLGSAEELVAMAAAGRGSLGALVRDPEIADDIKQTSRILKQQPWRAVGRAGAAEGRPAP